MSRSSIQLEQIQDQGATISRHVRETELEKKTAPIGGRGFLSAVHLAESRPYMDSI